jgi:hypothetical protein
MIPPVIIMEFPVRIPVKVTVRVTVKIMVEFSVSAHSRLSPVSHIIVNETKVPIAR